MYEQEAKLFFEDKNNDLDIDDSFLRLHTFPNVLITGHQAFFTKEALMNISDTTLKNINDFAEGKAADSPNLVL